MNNKLLSIGSVVLLKDANRVYDRPVNVADLRKTKEMFVDRQIDFRDEIS